MVELTDIRRLPRFSGISPEAEAYLVERMVRRTYGKGETIFMEGDPCSHFYIVLHGEVKIFKILESGRELIMDLFRFGESFGEVALIDGSEFPANAQAQEPTTVLTLTRKEYLHLLQRFPEAARSIIRDLSFRVRALRRRIEVLGEAGVPSRIAQLLQLYCRQFGRPCSEGLLIPIHLSRNELASLVGARIETVIRIMSRWQKENIIHTVPDGFVVTDPEALQGLISSEN